MNQIIAGVLVLGTAIGLFIASYLLNKKTPKPQGAELDPGCEGCSDILCNNNPAHKEEKGENK